MESNSMDEVDVTDFEAVLKQIHAQAAAENMRITPHAQQEMAEEDITLDNVLEVSATGQILENYPEHRRGACCLLNGLTTVGRPILSAASGRNQTNFGLQIA
ncbi:MAG: DUF4258 domain-containing protein, partial [bacterium]|nr:DUF4258 domain-containing protein [bacterium]